MEEIDYTPGRGGDRAPRAGDNFGWDVWEGRSRYEGGTARGHVPPAIAHSQGGGYCSIIGGYVIRDRSLGRGWTGRYVYGDYCNPVIRVARLRRGRSPNRGTGLRVPGLVSFGEDGQGRLRDLAQRAGLPPRRALRGMKHCGLPERGVVHVLRRGDPPPP